MEAVISEEKNSLTRFLNDCAEEQAQRWFDVCDKFLQWEREHILLVEPSEETQKEHRRALQVLLRLTRMINLQVSDPDVTNRSLSREMQWRLRQIEESWEMFYNPAPDADAILAKHFPE